MAVRRVRVVEQVGGGAVPAVRRPGGPGGLRPGRTGCQIVWRSGAQEPELNSGNSGTNRSHRPISQPLLRSNVASTGRPAQVPVT